MTELALIMVSAILVNNFVLVQFLGLCPFMGVSKKIETAIGLSLATTFVLTLAAMCSYLVQQYVLKPLDLEFLRTISFILVIAVTVQFTEMVVNKTSPLLYRVLGIFLPLITTNCVILGRADGFAAKHNPLIAGFDGLVMGIGFCLVLVVLGGLRELFGTGALFANMHLLFGPVASDWQITLFSDYKGFLLAILPPGAFIVLGLLIALKNRIDQHLAERASAAQPVAPAASRRVRVTGVIE